MKRFASNVLWIYKNVISRTPVNTASHINNFVGIENWSKERIDELRRFLTRENGIPSHDTLGRLFGLLDRRAVEKHFRVGVGSVLPALSAGQVVAIDGKASRRSRKKGLPPLHWVSAFATEARLILGKRFGVIEAEHTINTLWRCSFAERAISSPAK